MKLYSKQERLNKFFRWGNKNTPYKRNKENERYISLIKEINEMHLCVERS